MDKVWIGLNRYVHNVVGLDRFGKVNSGLSRFGQVWIDLERVKSRILSVMVFLRYESIGFKSF